MPEPAAWIAEIADAARRVDDLAGQVDALRRQLHEATIQILARSVPAPAPGATVSPALLTVDEAAARSTLTVTEIYARIRRGEITVVRPTPRTIRIPAAELDRMIAAMIEAQSARPAETAAETAEETAA